MDTKKKVAVCGALAAILGFLGTISTSACAGLPAQWQTICILGGKAAVEGSKAVNAHTPTELPDGGWVNK